MASKTMLGRREFLTGVATAATLRPLEAVAEQTPRIGVLVGLAPSEDTPIAQTETRGARDGGRGVAFLMAHLVLYFT
jgi:hypothetical protein